MRQVRLTDLLWSWGCWKERGCPNTNGLWTREEGGFAAWSKMEGAGRWGRDWIEFNMALSWSPAVGQNSQNYNLFLINTTNGKVSRVLWHSDSQTLNKTMPIQKYVEVGDHYPEIRDQKFHVVLILEAPNKIYYNSPNPFKFIHTI